MLAGILLFGQTVGGQEWAQWRGPTRDGVVSPATVPRDWPASLRRAWRVEIGEGYSSPVAANGRVFVHSRRDPDELVSAIDAANGQVIWQQKYAAPFSKNQYAVRMAKGPNSTPLVVGGRLYTLGATGVLTAWSADTGALVWRVVMGPATEQSRGRDLWFGSVRTGRAYVSYHLMPVYAFPDLLDAASPELKKRMQGKSCFNFREPDTKLFNELDRLTANGYRRFKEKGFIP
ncbi:MAG: PQQ-binding-like beta-propeller repeat protein [Vicinamibacterales bacterium]